jgi:hypothetical protein
LLHFQAIGGQLTQTDQDFIDFCDSFFKQFMKPYRTAGLPATF